MINQLLPEAYRLVLASVKYRVNPIALGKRYLHLYADRHFSPTEIHFQDLLNPGFTASHLENFVSKEELLTVQRRLNDEAQFRLTEDKVAFAQHCERAALRVPTIYAIYDDQHDKQYDEYVPVLKDPAALWQFLDALPANTIIIKPIDGVHGQGVLRLERSTDSWRIGQSGLQNGVQLKQVFESHGYRRWLLQELIRGSEELAALSGTRALQTIRIVTLVDAAHNVRVLAGRLRLVCGDDAHDNFDFGRTGNLIANLDVDSGRIRSVVGRENDRFAMTQVRYHPRTERPLVGYAVPQWTEAKRLAEQAARAFWPLRTIGWDVAVTPTAPCLIEGNVTWDTLIGENRMRAIFAELCNAADTLTA